MFPPHLPVFFFKADEIEKASMSFQAMTWAIAQKTENAGQKLVLLMLANHCNGHTGQCNPSHKLLAEECSMGLSTLKNHIAMLADCGFLQIIHKSVEGVSLPNQYHLNLEGVGQNLTDGGSESGRGVGQNLATKQEDKPTTKPIKKNDAPSCPEDVDQQTWNDWVSHRKSKGALASETAVAGARREAEKLGWTLNQFLAEWCTRGTQGLKAEWIQKDSRQISVAEQRLQTMHQLTGGITTPKNLPNFWDKPVINEAKEISDVERKRLL